VPRSRAASSSCPAPFAPSTDTTCARRPRGRCRAAPGRRRSAPRRPRAQAAASASPRVGLDHGGSRWTSCGVAAGDQPAEVEDVHAVGDPHHEVHVVLDESTVASKSSRSCWTKRPSSRPPRGSARPPARRAAAGGAGGKRRGRARSACSVRTAARRRAGTPCRRARRTRAAPPRSARRGGPALRP
jgi:hypothetical protein